MKENFLSSRENVPEREHVLKILRRKVRECLRDRLSKLMRANEN